MRLTIVPAKAVWTMNGKRAARLIRDLTFAVGQCLLELRLQGLKIADEAIDTLQALVI